MILKAQETKEIFFKLQKDLKRFRVNRSHCLNKDSPLEIIKNRTYFFDRFEKKKKMIRAVSISLVIINPFIIFSDFALPVTIPV